MTRLAAVLAVLAVAGCGGSSADPEPTYAHAYTVSLCSCTIPQVGHCVDTPTPTGTVTSSTCKEFRDGFGVVTKGWAYSPSPCPFPDCRMVGGYPTVGCDVQIECVERF